MALTGLAATHQLRRTGRLTPGQALDRLTYMRRGDDPADALKVVLASREETVPRLLEVLRERPSEVRSRYEGAPKDTAFYLHTLAFYILAAFEEPRAWPLILDYFTSDPELADELTMDCVCGELPAILVRCYDGSGAARLKSIIEDSRADRYFRHACLQAYHGLAMIGRIPRDEVIAFADRLLDCLAHEPQEWAEMVASATAELKEPSLRGRIEALFESGMIEPGRPFNPNFVDRQDIASIYADSSERTEEDILKPRYFARLVEQIGRWDWFQEPEEMDAATAAWYSRHIPQPYVRPAPKTGRNDPCPCGSGKKYKKCCLAAVEQDRDD